VSLSRGRQRGKTLAAAAWASPTSPPRRRCRRSPTRWRRAPLPKVVGLSSSSGGALGRVGERRPRRRPQTSSHRRRRPLAAGSPVGGSGGKVQAFARSGGRARLEDPYPRRRVGPPSATHVGELGCWGGDPRTVEVAALRPAAAAAGAAERLAGGGAAVRARSGPMMGWVGLIRCGFWWCFGCPR
jgi:hypothetical protein